MRIKTFDELTFSDDFVFSKVMKNPEICKELLERLLKIKIEKIEYPELQKEIKPYYSTKGVRLDVYVKDSNRIFDIEMQTTLSDNLPRRMRYYQSMVDIDALMKGEDYSSLKESFIIFLCTEDPLKMELPVYTFKPTCIEDKTCILDDGTTKIFFNASAADSEKDVEIRAILGYLLNGKSCDTFTQKVDSLVANLKDNEKFRNEYMAGALFLRDAKKQGFEEGFAQGALFVRDAKKQGFEEGFAQGSRLAKKAEKQGFEEGIAQQKAEDEKRIAQERSNFATITAQKDALLSSKDAEVARQAAEITNQAKRIAELEALLKTKHS